MGRLSHTLPLPLLKGQVKAMADYLFIYISLRALVQCMVASQGCTALANLTPDQASRRGLMQVTILQRVSPSLCWTGRIVPCTTQISMADWTNILSGVLFIGGGC